uniref:ubiquitinyl hydrolase 1 n=1 Tax=Amphiprion ocellaris TaxID=80972 RepID=A0AAQ5ZR14_AMPOC
SVGKGVSNGSYKGHRLFTCPEACALFLPISHVRLRHWSRSGNSDAHERGPASPPPFHAGQRVCFPMEDTVYSGEVLFCGPLPGRSSSGMYVGVLLDAPVGNWDGYYKGEKLCHVPSLTFGLLLPVNKVSSGKSASLLCYYVSTHLIQSECSCRFERIRTLQYVTSCSVWLPAFAEWGSERVEEHTPPMDGDEARELYQGWKRGIQGHLNSCYLDATLFSLFSCCSSADWVLFWPSDPETDQNAAQAQDLLRCEIVNPLRRFGYVCASKTMALRRLLEAANSDTGFTNQEKDPEEFLNKLFQLLRVEPLLKIRSTTQQPQECHLYQLFPPTLPPVASVQALLESSFLHAGLKFVEAPSCLLLLMPRFGKDFKMFDAILPSLSLDITDLLDDTLRQCSICQAVAEFECLQCYEDPDITPGRLKQYCHTCNTQVHSHRKRASHSPVNIGVPGGPWSGPLHCTRQRMSLFAVTCIETSHYVSFIKHGPLPTDWLFFDSMADREGGENGFNVPRVKACPEVGRYLSLSEEELSRVDSASLRESVRRLLCDSYMCLYHSPELSLYK